jgi:hypothetical protein
MSGDAAETVDLPLSFLARGRAYDLRLWRDGEADGTWRPTRRETRTATAAERLSVAMAPAGGFVAILDPAAR